MKNAVFGKKLYQIVTCKMTRVLVFLLVLLTAFTLNVHQAEAKPIDNIITKMYVTHQDNPNAPPGNIGMWQNFRVYAEFALSNNTVHENDTTVIKLPAQITFGNSPPSFELKDDKTNLVVAKAVINPVNKTVTLTYTKYVQGNSNITGKFYIYARVDHTVIRDEANIPLNFEVENKTMYGGEIHFIGVPTPTKETFRKATWQTSGYNDRLTSHLKINEDGKDLQNVVVTDTIKTPGLRILRDTLRILKGTWTLNQDNEWQINNGQNITNNVQITWAPNDAGFTIKLGHVAPADGIYIIYETKIPYAPADGEMFGNKAVLKGDNIQPIEKEVQARYLVAGGSAQGYVFKIKIKKVSEDNTPLGGAQFKVVRDRTGVVVGTITTDGTGSGEVGNLLLDDYTLTETQAPAGHQMLPAPIKITEADFGEDKIALKTVTNKKDSISVTFSKVAAGQGAELPGADLKVERADGTLVESWRSTSVAKVLNLPAGEYKMIESQAPLGYNIAAEIEFRVNLNGSVEIKQGGQWVPAANATVQMVDELKPQGVTFSKVAAGQGQELPGAELKVQKADGTVVSTWLSTGAAKVLNLPAGEYKMIESQAPLGYNIAAEIEFRVNLDGSVEIKQGGQWVPAANATVQMVDELKPQGVTFSKVAAGQGQELPGAELKVQKADGTVVSTWLSTGAAKVLNLPAGEYKMIESQAPLGYNIAAEIEFRVNLDGSVEIKQGGQWVPAANATVQMVDELKNYDAISVPLSAVKMLENGRLKAGKFSFQLLDNLQNVIETVQNNAAGQVVFSPRLFSRMGTFTYFIREVNGGSARISYDATVYRVIIRVTDVGGNLSAQVSYEKDTVPYDGKILFVNRVEVPKTGDSYTDLHVLITILSLALFGGIVLLQKKRKFKA